MRYINLLLFLLILLIAQSVNAQSKTAIHQNDKPFRVVIIGSSTAAGTGATSMDSAWVNRYENYLKTLNPENQVVNLAKSGYQTYHLLPTGFKIPPKRPYPDTLRNITQALALQPDAIIVNLPSNDAAAGYGVGEQLANFETIARYAAEKDVPIWFSTTQPRDFGPDKIAMQYLVRDSILQRFSERSINFWDDLSTPDGHIDLRVSSGDGIHVNNTGHALLFERVRTQNILEAIAARQKKYEVMNRIWAQAIPLSLHRFRPPPPKPQAVPSKQENVLLQASQPMEDVTVEIFNATGQLVRKRICSLPALIKTDFGPKGVYRISMRKGSFNKVVKLVKTTG
jgi:lysophospholipase L1-like esterase